MSSLSKPLVWLITGCSSGFGTSLSLTALRNGHKVIATSRKPSKDQDLVKQVEELGGTWLALDVNGPNSELEHVIEAGKKLYGRIDVLVNNAGVGIVGALEDVSSQEAHAIFDTNFFGPLKLIQTVLPSMRAQKSGVIVNISSAAGLDPTSAVGVYGASKWALEGMSQVLAKEVKPFGIRVLVVQPGAFTTNMMNAVNLTSKPITEDYKDTEVGKFVSMFGGGQSSYKAVNDVDKGCQGIFEVVTGTLRGKGKEALMRLPLSKDCAMRTRDHISRLQEGHDSFQDIWENTGHDDGIPKAFVAKK